MELYKDKFTYTYVGLRLGQVNVHGLSTLTKARKSRLEC